MERLKGRNRFSSGSDSIVHTPFGCSAATSAAYGGSAVIAGKKAKCEIQLISRSEYFDSDWYCETYPDVPQTQVSPAEHYYRFGAWLGRDPSERFSTSGYLRLYRDVEASGINPLVHFLVHGRAEGRLPTLPAPSSQRQPDSSLRSCDLAIEPLHQAGRRSIGGDARRILLCAHVAGRYLFGGERSLLDLLDGFSDCGIEVVVSVPALGNPEYLESLLDRCIALVCFPYGWWRDGLVLNEDWIACFAEVIAQYDVCAVHVNTIMLREPLVAARRLGVPGVVHVRELVFHDTALTDLIGLSPQSIQDQVLDTADWLIANSKTTADAFSAPERTIVIPNTVDLDELNLPARSVDSKVNVVMVSSNLPKKGLADFVELAKRASVREPSLRFLLIGPDNEHVEALQAARLAGTLTDSLVLAGYRDCPRAAMEEADIVVNLSHFQESFGRTVLEAMAASKPVVAYRWGALTELVQDQATGYLVPLGDIDGICDRLCELAINPDLRDAMGRAGRAAAINYGRDRFSARLRAAYGRIFDEAPAPRRLTLPARDLEGPAELRLAYFLWHFPVPSETFVLNELRVLVEQGVDVEVYCRQSPHPDFEPDFPIQWTRVSSVEEFASALIRTGRTMVHSHFTYPTVTEMVWPACERAGIKFTFIAHAQDIFREANRVVNRVGEIARSAQCVRVLAPSRFHHQYLVAEGVPDSKIFPTANSVDAELYAALEPRDFSRPRTRVCAVHRFTEKKGLIHLVRAAALLRDEGVQISLYGYGELEGAFQETISKLGLDNVHLMGPVRSRQELLEVFRDHDLFACPSVRAADGDMDGIPTVLMEAMAAGLPVLTTAVSGIPDLVEHRLTGYITEAEPEAIAAAVRQFMRATSHEVAAVARNAAERVSKHFCVRQNVRRMLRLWKNASFDVLIVSWNNPDQLKEVVERLQSYTSSRFHLVICDNGSQPATLALLSRIYARYSNTTVVLNRDNAMVGPGTNICLANSSSEIAVYVCGKEGFIFRKGWEQPILDAMEDRPEVGLAGTLCYSPTYLRAADYPAGVRLFDKFRGREFLEANPDRYMSHVQGGLFALRRSMVEEIGGFSDQVPHDYTDVEYSLYAESRGWQLGELDRLIALYVKTRPGLWDRVTEHNWAMHPPRLEDLPVLDRIVSGEVYHCPVCKVQAPRRSPSEVFELCSVCGSDPIARQLFSFLAGSRLPYRRLPALAIGLPACLHDFWKQQFQGVMLELEEAQAMARSGRRLDCSDARMKLVYLPPCASLSPLHGELLRVMAADAVVLCPRGAAPPSGRELEAGEMSQFGHFEEWHCRSVAIGCTPTPILVGRRAEPQLCVC